MLEDDELEPADTFVQQDEPKSSSVVLSALKDAQRSFESWQATCSNIDDIYSRRGGVGSPWAFEGLTDNKLDLFWSSYEILKPAVYARPPKPVVTPQFKDRRPLQNRTAELLERASVSAFDRSNINDVMCETRDDLIFTNRGVIWLTYEADEKGGGQRVCIEHLDRTDFLHEPARKWTSVGWVARRAWMTRKELRKRFRKESGDAYKDAKLCSQREAESEGAADQSRKAAVWEVWHRVDNKVYWVSEGVDVFLDEDEPHLKLTDFFPCPRPAYGTLARRTLIPVPDYERYAPHFAKINTLTARIYLLLDKVKMKGLIPSGGDVADAVEELIASDDDEILIPVPSAALVAGSSAGFVTWLPLNEMAQAIQGLIQARGQLIDDFYQLSGISDIMRGATEAEETLGAQQLKSQYGSVRVREKVAELQRIAADTVRIVAQIIAENFSKETLLDMSQMEIPSEADIKKRIKEIENAAEAEMKALGDQAEKAAQSPQAAEQDPAQAAQMFQQAQQQLIAKYAPMLSEASHQIPMEEIMDLLRDDRARGFAFEIETDSTVLTDELQEKQSRNELLQVFTGASQALTQIMAMGPQGAALAGAMLKFTLAPYRVGRELDGVIDEFIDAAPEIAKNMQAQQGGGDKELMEANNKLAEAEMQKAKAQMAKVEADSQLKQVEMQRKVAEMQAKAMNDQGKAQIEAEKMRVQIADTEGKLAETEAKVNLMQAQTAEILSKIGLDVRKQSLEEYKAANEAESKRIDQTLAVRSDQRSDRGEERADRQQTVAERQAMMEGEISE